MLSSSIFEMSTQLTGVGKSMVYLPALSPTFVHVAELSERSLYVTCSSDSPCCVRCWRGTVRDSDTSNMPCKRSNSGPQQQNVRGIEPQRDGGIALARSNHMHRWIPVGTHTLVYVPMPPKGGAVLGRGYNGFQESNIIPPSVSSPNFEMSTYATNMHETCMRLIVVVV